MNGPGLVPPKRFYKDVRVATVDGGYTVRLDEKQLPTPIGAALIVQVRALAEAIAAEWRAQGDRIDPASMPLGGYANTAIDRVAAGRQTILANMRDLAAGDLLCYRAAQPEDLARRQQDLWQPVLDWAGETLGASLRVTTGVLPIEQPAPAMEALINRLSACSDMELTAISSLATVCGSLILAVAVADKRLNGEQALDLAMLEESFQNERWGKDDEAQARQQRLKEEIASAERFLDLLRQ